MQIQHGATPGKSWLARMWSGMDDRFLKPLLTHSNPTLMETMPTCCIGLTRVLTSTEQLSKHPAMMGGTLTDDLDPVEGNVVVVTSPPSGQIHQDEDFRFPRRRSDDSDFNGGGAGFEGDIKRRQTSVEFPHGDGGGADKMPSHI